MKLGLSKIFALIVILFDVSNSMSQPFDMPETSIIKKNQIRKMKIYLTYDLDSNHNPKNNGKLNEVYYFNYKGLIVKEKRQFVTYHYKYDKENKLIFIKEKWEIGTSAWLEGYGSQFSIYKYNPLKNSVLINEYVGKYRKNHLKNKNPTKTLTKFFDSLDRDTLTVISISLFTFFNDTGFTRNIYTVLNDSITNWQQINNFPRKSDTLLMQIKISLKKQVMELNTLNHECPDYHYIYKGDLLFRIENYNCLDRLGDVYLYKYYR